jgi:hypothetical protein
VILVEQKRSLNWRSVPIAAVKTVLLDMDFIKEKVLEVYLITAIANFL